MASIKGGSSSKAAKLNREKAEFRWIQFYVRSLNATRDWTHKDPGVRNPRIQNTEIGHRSLPVQILVILRVRFLGARQAKCVKFNSCSSRLDRPGVWARTLILAIPCR